MKIMEMEVVEVNLEDLPANIENRRLQMAEMLERAKVISTNQTKYQSERRWRLLGLPAGVIEVSNT